MQIFDVFLGSCENMRLILPPFCPRSCKIMQVIFTTCGLLFATLNSFSLMVNFVLKLVDNLSSSYKENRDHDGAWISDLTKLAQIFYDFISPFSP